MRTRVSTSSEQEAGPSAAAERPLPLCVDLDGTLIRTDTLYEGFLASCTQGLGVFRALAALPNGKAHFKRVISRLATIDSSLLPYNSELIEYLGKEKSRGTHLVLATAASRCVADAVSSHLGLFDEVIASDDKINMRGKAKARALTERFGERGFRYAGNDGADLAVWRTASSAVLVNTTRRVAKAAAVATRVEAVIQDKKKRIQSTIRALRPYQWCKNLLVFVPVLTAHAERDARSWLSTILVFVAFCCVASGSYLVNDLLDLPADRKHLRKRNRPLASGALPIEIAFALIPLCFGAGAVFAYVSAVPLLVAIYVVMTMAYSWKLKRMPLVDFFCLSGLYVLRLFAGGKASGHPVSLWLLAFSSFLFLSLALVKRVAELKSHEGAGLVSQRAYTPEDLQTLGIIGIASSFASTVVLALYVQSDLSGGTLGYARPELLWPIVPLMLFWQCRLWLSTTRKYMLDDPIVYAAKDWVSWLVGLGMLTSMALSRLQR
jgi:4-hydroxybenzoate polyprenyltransferase/phosphoserine phosphatase